MKEYFVNRIEKNQLFPGFALEKTFWNKATLNTDFCYPWEKGLTAKTSFKALHDCATLYFQFEVACHPALVFVKTNHKMEVNNSDRVEIFFRKNDKLDPYYGIEMDANGRLMDYKAKFYRELDFNWNWPKNGIQIKSERTTEGYTLTGAISFSSLKQLELLNDQTVEAGLYRGHCVKLPDHEYDADLKWISWVKPNSDEPDFHIPSSFGKLVLK